MRVVTWWITVIGVANFVLMAYTSFNPEAIRMLFSGLTLVVLVIALFLSAYHGFRVWRRSSRLWILPALMCLAFLVSTWLTAGPTGRFIADWEFKRHLNEYVRVVEDLKSGKIPCGTGCNGSFHRLYVKDQPKNIIFLEAARCNDGAVGVAFLVDTDVILLHEGYFFKGYGDGTDCSAHPWSLDKKYPYVRHVEGNWYHFADEPGL